MTKGIGSKKAVLNGLRLTGLHRLLRPLTGGMGAILTFHRVRPPTGEAFQPNANLEVTPEFLADAIDWLRRREIDIVTMDEALRRLKEGSPRRFAVITFDDGYRDNRDHALPVLKARNAPFIIYVPTGLIDRAVNPWWMTLEEVIRRNDRVAIPGAGDFTTTTVAEKSSAYDALGDWLESIPEVQQRAAADDLARRYGFDVRAMVDEAVMTWDELAGVAAEPLVTIGAHTVNHVALGKLSEEDVRREVLDGAAILEERLGAWPRHFAYPYGFDPMVTERDWRILADLGFASAVRTEPGVLSSASTRQTTGLPRISMNGHFQELRYVDVLLSGVPFALQGLAARITGGRPKVQLKASAST
ncbi:MAG: polysaccharide deacetylase family protein [Bauldia sp.]|nr:polysaccharide deacetylase family protein [Bauldia sp.]